MLDHDYIGTEHLLLGLIADQEGVAARVLRDLGSSRRPTRQKVVEIIGRGEGPATGHVRMTPRAKKVLELSLRESIQLKDKHIGPGTSFSACCVRAMGSAHRSWWRREPTWRWCGRRLSRRSARSRRSLAHRSGRPHCAASGTATVAAMAASSKDEIRLTGISVRAHHGVYPEEQEQGQDFVVDLVAHLDLTAPGESDRLEDTADYGDSGAEGPRPGRHRTVEPVGTGSGAGCAARVGRSAGARSGSDGPQAGGAGSRCPSPTCR